MRLAQHVPEKHSSGEIAAHAGFTSTCLLAVAATAEGLNLAGQAIFGFELIPIKGVELIGFAGGLAAGSGISVVGRDILDNHRLSEIE